MGILNQNASIRALASSTKELACFEDAVVMKGSQFFFKPYYAI
jgi:hypothetical protein